MEQKHIFKEIVEKYHSYVAHVRHIGRRLDYLVTLGDKHVGAVGLGSIPMPISKGILNYFEPMLGRTNGKVMLKPIFNSIADNWRFCLTPEAPKNSGSRVLAIFLRLAQKDWEVRFGDKLKWVITYVEEAHKGTIYKAAGWKYLGKTGGLVPTRDFVHGERRPDGMFPAYKTIIHMTGKSMTDWRGQPHLPEKQVAKKHIFLKDLRKKGEGEAIVVQGEHAPPSSGEMAVTPTQSHHSYHTEVKGGKVRIVWD